MKGFCMQKEKTEEESAKKYITVIERMFEISSVPMALLKRNGETLYCKPYTAKREWPVKMIKMIYGDLSRVQVDKELPYLRTSSLDIYMSVFNLDDEYYLTVGPVSTYGYELDKVIEVYEDAYSRDEILALYHAYTNVGPVDIARFSSLISVLFELVSGNRISPITLMEHFHQADMGNQKSNELIQRKRRAEQQNDKPMDRAQIERAMEYAVQTGNRARLNELWNDNNIPVGKRRFKEEDWMKYRIIPFLTVVTRAAIRGGVPENSANALFETLVEQCHEYQRVLDVYDFMMKASYEFCDLVFREKNGRVETGIHRNIEQYVNNHLREKLTIADFEKHFGISKRQVYRIFEKEFQMTMSEYVHRQRIGRSVEMLGTTDMSISEISNYWGYASQSHFNQIFRRYMNCTPGEYRNGMKYQ